MRRFWLGLGLLAGCSQLVEESPELWPPPVTDVIAERADPGSFDPCPRIAVEPARRLSFSAAGTSDPRIAWNVDLRQFVVVWREGDELLWRRLDEDGAPIGLQQVLRTTDSAHAIVRVTSDPTVLTVPGLQPSPFFVTVQTDDVIAVDRILDDDERQEGEPLAGALPTDTLVREERVPVLATDGDRIALAYRTVADTALVSLPLSYYGEAHCLHQQPDTDNPDAIVCEDNATVVPGVAAIGWLPPAPAGLDGTAEEEPSASTMPSWWMPYRNGTSLRWVTLDPVGDGDTLDAHYPRFLWSMGASDFVAGPRVASGTRRLAVALRRDEDAPVTQAWQLTDDLEMACVVSTSDLSVGTPAVAWAHGRRLTVVGLTRRAGPWTDVVIARADAPFTELDREAAVQEGRVCPPPLDLTEVTTGVQARDPDVAFSGDALGVVWAQEETFADVWFALARCVGP